MTDAKVAKNFLFCRGKRADRGGKEWFTTLYIYNNGKPFHLNLYF